MSLLKKGMKALFDPGFLFTLGNAILFPSPFTVVAAGAVLGVVSAQNIIPKKPNSLLSKVISNPGLGLVLAGVALLPGAVAAYGAIPWAMGASVGLLTNTAFLSAIATTSFIAFDFIKPLEMAGKWKKFSNTNIFKRTANVVLTPDIYPSIGLMAISAMAGPVGYLMLPVIGVSATMTLVNSQRENSTNQGRPKVWLAATCLVNAIAAAVTNPIAAVVNVVAANMIYSKAYVSLEVLEGDGFLNSITNIMKKGLGFTGVFEKSKKTSVDDGVGYQPESPQLTCLLDISTSKSRKEVQPLSSDFDQVINPVTNTNSVIAKQSSLQNNSKKRSLKN